jgi:predicted nucleic acid-binding protein
MKRVLLDVNLVLDVLLDRAPHAETASDIWAAVEMGQAQGFLSAHAITTIHYLNGRSVGPKEAKETTEALLGVFDIATVDEAVIRAALALQWSDFEDAVTAAAAQRARCAAIVTRNPRDFRRSPVTVFTPKEAAVWLGL